MRRILVLQMCRLGDILQTIPMLRGLRRAHPDAELTLVLHDTFAGVPVPAGLVDRVLAFPYGTIARTMAGEPHEWPREVARLREFVRDLGSEPYDVTLNLTHTDLSGLMAAVIPARRVEGALVAPDRTRIVRGEWMAYFWASQSARADGCFNMVDLQNWAAGVPSDARPPAIDIPDEAERRVESWLADRGLSGRRFLAVQLGASEDRKRWPPDCVAAAIDALPDENGEILLVGKAEERALGNAFRAAARRRVHDAYGETSLLQLAALLRRAGLLLTNDTGTMHVAASVGTRIVAVSTGPVFVHETGPYGEGHFVIEPEMTCFPCAAGSRCHHFSCRRSIEPSDVAALVRHACGAGPLPRASRARILQGRFLPSGRIEYRTIGTQRPSSRDVMRGCAARVWEESLGAPHAGGQPARPTTRLARPGDGAGAFASACVTLGRLAAEARAASAIARSIAKARSHDVTGALARIDHHLTEMDVLAQVEPACQAIVAYQKTRLSAIASREVAAVAAGYARECRGSAERARRLSELLGQADADQAAGPAGVVTLSSWRDAHAAIASHQADTNAVMG